MLSLPCSRTRHEACAGAVTIGIARRRHEHACLCFCHQASAYQPSYLDIS